jgi:hypothetical protein
MNKLRIGDWEYSFEHDNDSGELTVHGGQRLGLVRKAVEYAKAEVSGLVGKVELPVLEARKSACGECESVKKAGEEEWYCKSCGCPEWERSKLQVKWGMPAAKCPLGKWPVNG